ncbi:MAG: EFR1 family ferrodoxin [Lachnospiraceae bacterium]|nr:EFR1 family ferrodoxin [Lachnospiraceae bacterium]
MVGIYLSGTGNTKHCLERFLSLLDPGAELIAIESSAASAAIGGNDEIVLAYPTQFSNIPYMVRDFIRNNGDAWKGKKVFCMTTMGLFSGDGTGCAARLLKKYGASVSGGLQLLMPDAVCDSKLLKKSVEENKRIVAAADRRLEKAAEEIRSEGKYPREGLGFAAHLAGLFGQRLWFYGKTADYCKKVKISDDCVGCGSCVKNCPMENLSIKDGKAVSAGRCTMCYRCVSQCPKKAVTILGNRVYEQCRYEKYVPEPADKL